MKGRVLHLIDMPGPGGAETVYLELVRRLPALGWESLAVVPGGWLAEALRREGIEPVELATRRSLDLRFVGELRRLAKRERVSLVQTHLLGSAVYGAIAAVGTGLPVVSTFHGRPDVHPGERFRSLKLRLLRGSRIVFVSRTLREFFVSKGDFSEDAVVIHNGIELDGYAGGESRSLRSELGLAPSAPLVGAIGNVRPSKAYDVLLRAFGELCQVLPAAHLVIAGQDGGELGKHLRTLAMGLGLENQVHLLGFRDDVADILRSIDVFAISSSDEGFSLATVQAMAAGLPVVSTRSGGPEEIVGDSGGAIFVPSGEPAAFAAALTRVIGNSDLAERMGQAARNRARAAFSIDRMIEGYADLYTRTLREW